MASIKVNNLSTLNISGAELFNDSESFMTELSDESEQIGVFGGQGCIPSSQCEVTDVCIRKSKILVIGYADAEA